MFAVPIRICFLLAAIFVVQQAKCGLEAVLKERYLDFLDILITARDENGKGLSRQEIQDEVDTFLFEGITNVLSIEVSYAATQ